MTDLVLASASPFRKSMLAAARISFRSVKAEIDERAVEAALGPADAETVAAVLAEAKAVEVSRRFPEAMVIGCDQTLALGAARFHKPRDLDEARRNLLRLRGRTHQLHSAVVLSRNGETLWRHVGTVDMTMRDFDAAYAGRYLASIGDRALASVGSYQIEAEGIHLFEKIEGDYFSIVGMPLLPLLAELRRRGVIDG
jgi:septum formation protein